MNNKIRHYTERFLYLTLLLVFVSSAISIYLLADYSKQNRRHLMAVCESANELRTAERQLWDHIFELTESDPRTPAEQKRVADFQKYLDQNFALEDCDK